MFWNQLKTVFLLGGLSGLLLLLGNLIGGSSGLTIAFIMALLMNGISYFFSDKIVLKSYGAQKLDPSLYGHIYTMVEDLAHEMSMPMPKLWYVNTPMANAFATGRSPKHGSVAVTQGILDILDDHELRGVLAHELSHVKNRDILVGSIAATIAMAIGYLASMFRWSLIFGGSRRDGEGGGGLGAIIVAILMPFAAMLIQMAISRSREYLADSTGAHACKDPLSLARALEKISSNVQHAQAQPRSHMQASTASLFIVYPFRASTLMHLFSTHPPMAKRIARLHNMAQEL